MDCSLISIGSSQLRLPGAGGPACRGGRPGAFLCRSSVCHPRHLSSFIKSLLPLHDERGNMSVTEIELLLLIVNTYETERLVQFNID